MKIGWVAGKVVDEHGNATPEMKSRAFSALVENIPLIIGFKDLLEKYHIDIDAKSGRAFIERR
ncbi:hypothetical protein KEJ39_08680 [Candidatus Bathyarchaeota archaeon]|nr:hypothetical protein [Candidatus Bathyarchaeota archaeon]